MSKEIDQEYIEEGNFSYTDDLLRAINKLLSRHGYKIDIIDEYLEDDGCPDEDKIASTLLLFQSKDC